MVTTILLILALILIFGANVILDIIHFVELIFAILFMVAVFKLIDRS